MQVLPMLAAGAVPWFVACTRALGPGLLSYWRHWSPRWCAAGSVLVPLLLAGVSGAGLAVFGLHGASLAAPVLGSAAAQTSVRRRGPGRATRGGSLAGGLVQRVQDWVDEGVGTRVRVWAGSLADADLVAEAARVVAHVRPRGASDKAAEWLDLQERAVLAGGVHAVTARERVVDYVVDGVARYRLFRQP